ncbi:MAG: hypothetical protein ACKVQU_05325 [Burkholderiales bacterium]
MSGAPGANLSSPTNSEPSQISWLRSFSRYLAPRAGLLTLDSVTLATTWVRNVFLNLLVMVALLGVVLMIPWLLVLFLNSYRSLATLPLGELSAVLGAGFFGTFALQLYSQDLKHRRAFLEYKRLYRILGNYRYTLAFGFAYVFLSGLWAAAYPANNLTLACGVVISVTISLLFASAVSLLLEWLIEKHYRQPAGPWQSGKMVASIVVFTLAGIVSIAAATACFVGVREAFAGRANGTALVMLQLTLAPPLAMLTFGVCGSLFVGTVGREYAEGSREWWARLNAFFVRMAFVLLFWFGMAFGSAGIVNWLWESADGWLGALVASSWIGSAFAALVGPKVDVKLESRRRLLASVFNVAALIFAAGLLLLAAAGVHNALNALGNDQSATRTTADDKTVADSKKISACAKSVRKNIRAPVPPLEMHETSWSRTGAEIIDCVSERAGETAQLLSPSNAVLVLAAFGSLLLAFAFLGWRVDVNRFSLHDMYKVRLIRCYLGASNVGQREPNPFTGFDQNDDLVLEDIDRRQRPFHLLNAAINLTVNTNLAWQQRKAANFTFSSLFCGFVPPREELRRELRHPGSGDLPLTNGYIPTILYGKTNPKEAVSRFEQVVTPSEHGLTLGSAVATSGAAISPTSGMNTRPALAFILTLFNLRTGRWSPNTLNPAANAVTPLFGSRWLLQELFGAADARGKFVHLSDGGHFDNLGIYELVRRRCNFVICVDATADPRRQFSDLGDVVRKCRVDLGVSIEVDTRPLAVNPVTGLADRTVIEGTIKYPDRQFPARFFYVKPGLVDGIKLPDLLTHHSTEPTFPHVATADQLFNESQFESYRRLGELVGEQLLETIKGKTA